MKPGWTTVALGELCELKYGKSLPAKARSGEGFPVFGSSGLVGAHEKAIQRGPGIIVGRKGSIGEVHWSEDDFWPIDTTYFALPRRANVDLRWLYLALQWLPLKTLNKAAAVPGLNRDDAYRLTLALPPLEEQRRVASILDRAVACRASNEALEGYFEATSHALMERIDWSDAEEVSLSEVSEVQGGLQVSSKRISLPREVPYLRVANVHRGHLRLAEVKTLRATDREIERTALREGDLLFVEGHANPDEVGRVAAWPGSPEKTVHQNHLIRARLDGERALPAFVSAFLNSSPLSRRHFREHAKTTSGLNTISASVVKSAPVLLPPLSVQNRFSQWVDDIGGHRDRVQERSKVLEELFASLQSRAFRGELCDPDPIHL